MTPEIKQKIEGKYSDIKCSDINYRLKAAAEFGYSLASSEIEELKREVAKYEIDKIVLKELGEKLERSEREVERLKGLLTIATNKIMLLQNNTSRSFDSPPLNL